MAMRRVISTTLLLVAVGGTTPGLAATPRLVLGRAHVRPDGTAVVPVVLRTRRADGIAALDFRLETADAGRRLVVTGADGGGAVSRAHAQLGVSVAAGGNGLQAMVVPKFGLPLPVLRRGRVATVYVRGGTSPRRIRRALRFTQVTFADITGKAMRPQLGTPRGGR